MSSVEQKIREIIQRVEDCRGKDESKWENSLTGAEATQSILQIIESDVIGEDFVLPPIASPYTEEQSNMIIGEIAGENRLRAKQRANLREEK